MATKNFGCHIATGNFERFYNCACKLFDPLGDAKLPTKARCLFSSHYFVSIIVFHGEELEGVISPFYPYWGK